MESIELVKIVHLICDVPITLLHAARLERSSISPQDRQKMSKKNSIPVAWAFKVEGHIQAVHLLLRYWISSARGHGDDLFVLGLSVALLFLITEDPKISNFAHPFKASMDSGSVQLQFYKLKTKSRLKILC